MRIRALGLVSLAALSACGRINFDERADAASATGDGDMDGEAVVPCTPAWFDIPGALSTGTYALARVPTGWATLTIAAGSNDLELRIIGDDNAIGPVLTLASPVASGFPIGVAFVGQGLHVVWTFSGNSYLGRFALDGTSLGTMPLNVPSVGALSSDSDRTAMPTYNNGVVALDAFDANAVSISGAHTVTSLATVPAAFAAHGAGGYGVLWMNGGGPFQLHLTGLDESGAVVLADRILGTTSNRPEIVWTGTQYVISWAPSGGTNPLIATVDANFAPVSGPFTPLGITTQIIPLIAWNDDELGYVRFGESGSGADQRFSPMDLAGVATGPDVLLGDASGSQTSGALIAGGLRRFGMLWTSGAQFQMRFGVVCR
jgi:hypothetical protein